MHKLLTSRWTKLAVFFACLSPLALLAWTAAHSGLGPNPVDTITFFTGNWTLRFLALTLLITPARKLLRLPALIRFRRMLGLFAFFYVCLHFLIYIVLDQSLSLQGILRDVAKRPYITAGFTGFVLLLPLAVTSTAGWIRRLGGKNWSRLHRLIYVTAIAGVVHYYWLVKSDKRLPLLYAAIITLLLAARVAIWLRDRQQAAHASRHRERARIPASSSHPARDAVAEPLTARGGMEQDSQR